MALLPKYINIDYTINKNKRPRSDELARSLGVCWAVCLLAVGVFAVGERFDVEALVNDSITTVGEV